MKNFKAVRDATLELAPLTVVVGANSAGKSTLLQSIRSVVQAGHVFGAAFPLNGDQVRLGTFEETLWSGAHSEGGVRQVELGARFKIANRPNGSGPDSFGRRRGRLGVEFDWEIALAGQPPGQPAMTWLNQVEVRATTFDGRAHHLSASRKASGSASQGSGENFDGSLRREGASTSQSLSNVHLLGGFPLRAVGRRALLPRYVDAWLDVPREAALEIIGNRRSFSPSTGAKGKVVDVGHLASMIAEDIKTMLGQHTDSEVAAASFERREIAALRQLAAERGFVDFSINANELALLVGTVEQKLGRALYGDRLVPLPSSIGEASELVREFFRNRVQHLGPLRENPQVVYTAAPLARSGYLGDKGEYTAAVLQANGMDQVVAPLPPTDETPNGLRSATTTLMRAVNAWAAFLGIADGFATTDEGRLGIRLMVQQGDVDLPLDLTSVGTGVSQLLPVLVMCLQAPAGSLLLIEQPELHLNPRVQQRLADFLLAIASTGKQLIVETHSDYLVNRLRLRSIVDKSNVVSRRVTVVFAERSGAETSYHASHLSVDGSLDEWPSGFLDEAARESERIIRAVVDRKQMRGLQGMGIDE